MATASEHAAGPGAGTGTLTAATGQQVASYAFALARLLLGWIFLWAFLDKTFGLGHETASKASWLNGGSPTKGFLGHAAAGPFKSFYHSIAGAAWADWLFMLGLLGIGVALLLGVAVRVAGIAGAVLVVLMWSVVLPPENNLFADDHLVYAALLIGLAFSGIGLEYSLSRQWQALSFVQKNPWLR